MTWTALLNKKCVTAAPTSKSEIDNLRSIVSRSMTNVAVAGLATDIRFILAYDAARTVALMVVRAEGYRPRGGGRALQHVPRPGGRRPGVCGAVFVIQQLPNAPQPERIRLCRRHCRQRR